MVEDTNGGLLAPDSGSVISRPIFDLGSQKYQYRLGEKTRPEPARTQGLQDLKGRQDLRALEQRDAPQQRVSYY